MTFPDTPGGDDLTAITDGLSPIEEGETVVANVPVDAVHVFDQDSGEALHNRRLDRVEETPPV